MIIDKELNVSNRKRADIVAELRKKNFRAFPKQAKAVAAADVNEDGDEPEEISSDNDFDYLLNMAIYNLTREKVERLLNQRDEKEKELNELLGRTPASLWEADLDALEAQWASILEDDKAVLKDAQKIKKPKAPVKRAPKAAAAARKVIKGSDIEIDDSEDDFKPTKAAAKPRASPAAKKSTAVKRSASVLDDDDLDLIAASRASSAKPSGSKPFSLGGDDDDVYMKPAKAGGSGARKPSAGKANGKGKGKASEDEDDDVMLADLPAREKSGRARKASAQVTYIDSEDDDDE